MTEGPNDSEALNALGRKYLDLWLEHWASCLAAPEASAAMARIFAAAGGMAPGAGLAGSNPFAGWPGAGLEPQAFRTAPNAGADRVDDLEKRIAELERRLAELGPRPSPGLAGSAVRPRRRTRKV